MEFLFKEPIHKDSFKGTAGFIEIMWTRENPFFFSHKRLKKIALQQNPEVINYFDSLGLRYMLMRCENGKVFAVFVHREDLDYLKLMCEVKYDTSFEEYSAEIDRIFNNKSLSVDDFSLRFSLASQKLMMNTLFGHLEKNIIWDRTL